MSQVLENPSVNGTLQTRPMEQAPMGEPQQGFDIVKILWRWKWLPILGSILGAALGALYFSKQPAEYMAKALVQVIETVPRAIQPFDGSEVASYSRMDESLLVKSQKV